MEVFRFGDLPPALTERPLPPVRLQIADGLLTATQRALREASDGVRESTVLWAGRPGDNGVMFVSHLLLPDFISTYGFLTIPIDERIKVADFLRSEELLAVADLHTHPREAFLSRQDRLRPFSRREGFYAIVVPNFGTGEAGAGWRCYEARKADWTEVEMEKRIDAWNV